MTDELKRVYKGAGALDRYFDGKTPVDLFRGKKRGSQADLMQPTLVGWSSAMQVRHPDVLVVDQHLKSPQYKDEIGGELVTETKKFEFTAEILRNSDQYVVKGCRTMHGEHRGISVFDKRNPRAPFEWYLLPANSKLPDALAVTCDAQFPSKDRPNHYTIAPKDDMPLALFLQYLKSLEAQTSLSNVE